MIGIGEGSSGPGHHPQHGTNLIMIFGLQLKPAGRWAWAAWTPPFGRGRLGHRRVGQQCVRQHTHVRSKPVSETTTGWWHPWRVQTQISFRSRADLEKGRYWRPGVRSQAAAVIGKPSRTNCSLAVKIPSARPSAWATCLEIIGILERKGGGLGRPGRHHPRPTPP